MFWFLTMSTTYQLVNQKTQKCDLYEKHPKKSYVRITEFLVLSSYTKKKRSHAK